MIVRRISCIIAFPGMEDNHKSQLRNTNCVVKTMGVVVKEISSLKEITAKLDIWDHGLGIH